jgi:hypothetical protein
MPLCYQCDPGVLHHTPICAMDRMSCKGRTDRKESFPGARCAVDPPHTPLLWCGPYRAAPCVPLVHDRTVASNVRNTLRLRYGEVDTVAILVHTALEKHVQLSSGAQQEATRGGT